MRKVMIFAVTAMLMGFSTVLTAQEELVLGVGGRVGATVDPDQAHFGIHFDLGEIAERVRVQPNVEIGVGDDLTVVAINPELFYLFNHKSRWTPYAGGGLGVNIYNWDTGVAGVDDSEVEVGLNLLGGLETMVSDRTKIFFEGKFGVGDSPDFKATFGFTYMM